MRIKSIIFSFLGFLFWISLFGQSAESFFIEGNILFAKEEYAEAKDAYLKSLDISESSNLHYNLANTYWKLNQPSQAIFHFYNALLLNPSNSSARGNLNYLLKLNKIPADFVPTENIFFLLNENQWAWLIAIAFWIFLSILLLRKLTLLRNAPIKLLTLILAIICSASGTALYRFESYKSVAINLNKETVLKIAPTEQSPPQVTTDSWEFMKVLTQTKDYYYLELRDGTRGYALKSNILSIDNEYLE